MKMTVAISPTARFVTFPDHGAQVLTIERRSSNNGKPVGEWFVDSHFLLTPESVGALMFAWEQGAEEMTTAAERIACAGSALCSVPAVACETPNACTVA